MYGPTCNIIVIHWSISCLQYNSIMVTEYEIKITDNKIKITDYKIKITNLLENVNPRTPLGELPSPLWGSLLGWLCWKSRSANEKKIYISQSYNHPFRLLWNVDSSSVSQCLDCLLVFSKKVFYACLFVSLSVYLCICSYLEKGSDWRVDPSLSDGGSSSQRDLGLDHLVHKTPGRWWWCDEHMSLMIFLMVIKMYWSSGPQNPWKMMMMIKICWLYGPQKSRTWKKIKWWRMMTNLKRRTTRMPPMINETPNSADRPGE